MSWLKDCIISEISITPRIAGTPNAILPVANRPSRQTTWATFQISNTKPYVPVVKLSVNDDIKSLKSKKKGFKRKVYWNNCRFEIPTQPKKIIR